jgi:hypothetical protein
MSAMLDFEARPAPPPEESDEDSASDSGDDESEDSSVLLSGDEDSGDEDSVFLSGDSEAENEEDEITWEMYEAINVPAKSTVESWDVYSARASRIRLAGMREELLAGSRPAPDLLLGAAQCHEAELLYFLLAEGAPVNVRIHFPEYDEDELDTAEKEDAWRKLYGLHGRNALELCSNASLLISDHRGKAEGVAWTLTKLVILAGGTGNPLGYLGFCPYEEVYYGNNHREWLCPLLESVAATSQELRRWWLSDAGAHDRWKAFGGELLCLLESLAAKDGLDSRRSRRLMGASLCCIEQVAQLPKPLRSLVAKLARPERNDAITQLFRTHACGGDWDEVAFQAIS